MFLEIPFFSSKTHYTELNKYNYNKKRTLMLLKLSWTIL